MTKHLRYLFVMLMGLLGVTTGWAEDAPDVSYDFTGTDWTASNGVLTNGTVSFSGQGGANFKMNSGYFMMGKSGAYINFPIYSSDVEKIVVTGRSGASAATLMNIYVGDTEVSTETEGSTGTNAYEIASGYQAAGTQYTLKVTSNHNAQVTQIDVYFKKGSAATVAIPSFNPIGGIYTEAKSVEISCATEGAYIYYTTDGTDPDNQSTLYSSAITVDEDMTIKAIAYSGSDASSIATAEYTIISLDHAGTEADPYSVADAFKVLNYNLNKNGVYVKGTVSTAPESISKDGELTYYISDDGTTTTEFEIYKGKGKNGASFTSVDDVQVGDQVIVYGDIQIYSGIYEFKQNSQMVWNSRTSKEVVSIAVSGDYPTTFFEGDAFSHEGAVVTATYDDGTPGDVTANATFSEPNMNQPGVQTVTVTYEDKTAEYTITINEVPSHTATFSVNGATTTADVKEGAAITFPEDPADIEGKSFVGWTDTEIGGTTDDEPDFVTSATMGDQDVTFYAVFANVTQGTELQTAEITATTDGVPSSYGTANAFSEYTLSGITFQIRQMYKSGGKLQWRAAGNSSGTGTMYNTDELKYIQTIVLTYNSTDSKKNFTVKVGDEENPSTGTSIEPTISDNVYTFDCSSANAGFFVLTNGENAGYLDKIEISYTETPTTCSDYCTTVEAAATSESITISAALYATYITTNDLDFTGTAVTAFIVDEATTANVHFKEVKKVPAATPIVVKAAAAGTYDIPVTTEETDNVEANKLLAPEAGQTSTGVEYCLANKTKGVGFYPVLEGVAIKKAYLIIRTTSAPEFIGFIEDGGISTGISTVAVENAELNIDAPMYNIAGQRVSRSYKGVVIQNGKKFVVK